MRRATRELPLAFIFGLLALGVSSPTSAQQRFVRGVVFDSLRAEAPLIGVEVALIGTGRKASTDSAGRFEFSIGLDERAESVALWLPWLDSLALPPLHVPLAPTHLDHGVDVILATPSRLRFQRALCGAELSATSGVLIGEAREVDGAGRSGTVVVARWTEMRIGAGQVSEHTIATVDTTSESGLFVLCGVPVESIVSLRALPGDRGSGERWVPINEWVQRHDLVVGAPDIPLRVYGRVELGSGAGIGGAHVTLSGDPRHSARTDSTGLFELTEVPRRSGQLEVRAIGFAPTTALVDPTGPTITLAPIRLEPLPPELDAVRVTADPYERDRLAFERRRRGPVGRFITEKMLADVPQVSAYVLASFAPGVRVAFQRNVPVLRLRQGSGACDPLFFEDGVNAGRNTPRAPLVLEHAELIRRAKRVEIYAAGQAPPEFTDFEGCGAVVVWTR